MLTFTVEINSGEMSAPETHTFPNIAEASIFLKDIDFKGMFKDEVNGCGSIEGVKNRQYFAYLNAIDEMGESETLDMRYYDYANYTADRANDRY